MGEGCKGVNDMPRAFRCTDIPVSSLFDKRGERLWAIVKCFMRTIMEGGYSWR